MNYFSFICSQQQNRLLYQFLFNLLMGQKFLFLYALPKGKRLIPIVLDWTRNWQVSNQFKIHYSSALFFLLQIKACDRFASCLCSLIRQHACKGLTDYDLASIAILCGFFCQGSLATVHDNQSSVDTYSILVLRLNQSVISVLALIYQIYF